MSTSRSTRPVIAHVVHRLEYAGAEVLAAALSRELKAKYRWLFFCLDAVGPLGEQLKGEGFEVFSLDRKPGLDWAVAKQIRKLCRRRRVDLLHAHQYTPFFYAAVSRRLSRYPRILFTEHGRHYPDSSSAKRILANKWLLRSTDRATAVGEFVRQALIKNEGMPASRIEVIHNGIDPQKFALANRQTHRAAVRAELGVADDEPVILQVARFHPVKDHATSIEAFSHVVKASPKAHLVLAGDGSEIDAMKQLADQLHTADRVHFLGVRTDVPRLMAAADVFTLSSLSEGISVTLLEAMAARLPIAATEVGGNGEVVKHNETGLLSPRRDSASLAQNLITLLRDAALRKTFGNAGHDRLHQHFTQAKMHAQYDEMYAAMT